METPLRQRLTDIIEDNFSNPSFGAEELARALGLSYSSLRRKYFALTGKTITHLIREVRLKKAMELLQDKSLSISEVATRTGFRSAAYFSTCFHEYFGYPPGERRKDVKVKHDVGTHNCVRIKHDDGTQNCVRESVRNCVHARGLWLEGVAIILVMAGALMVLNASGKVREEKSIAVLPFRNLSADTLSVAFCDGFWNQVINALDKIKVFNVRSGVSSGQYRVTDKSFPEIGRELDADFIIDGSVDQEGDLFKVRVELIEAKNNKQIWADDYPFKIGETFKKLDDIAQHIAYRLNTIILPREMAAIGQKCTKSPEAWDNFLKAEYLSGGERGGSPEMPLPYRRKTIELDPAWSDAYIRLSQTLQAMYRSDPREEYLQESLKSVEKAHELYPGPDTWMELVNHHLTAGNMVKAREYFKKVRKGFLDDNYMNFKLGRTCRTFGLWKDAVDRLLRVHKENPEAVQNNFILGQTYELLRDFTKAEKYYNQGIAYNPPWTINYYGLADISLKWKGDTQKSRKIIEDANKQNPWVDDNLMRALYQYVMIDVYEGKYREALDELSRWFYVAPRWAPPYYYRPKYLFYAMIYGYQGKQERELAYYDSTRIYIGEELAKFPLLHKRPTVISCLGVAWAGMGNKEKALEMADRVDSLLSANPDEFSGPFAMEDVARIYTKTGDYTKSLKILKKLLSKPGPLTVKLLELDPGWEPLRGLSQYQRLMKKYQPE